MNITDERTKNYVTFDKLRDGETFFVVKDYGEDDVFIKIGSVNTDVDFDGVDDYGHLAVNLKDGELIFLPYYEEVIRVNSLLKLID